MEIINQLIDYVTTKETSAAIGIAESQLGENGLSVLIEQLLGLLQFKSLMFPVEFGGQEVFEAKILVLLEACPDLRQILSVAGDELQLADFITEHQLVQIAKTVNGRLGPPRIMI